MKKLVGTALLVLLASASVFAQKKSQKLSKEESAKMTQDQRILHETARKSKGGKKDVSMKKKVKIDKKQARKSKRMKQPKKPKRY